MTTLDYTKEQRRGFFSIYKPGQGKWVRWGTVAAMAVITLTGVLWMTEIVLSPYGIMWQAIGGSLWTLVFALFTFWIVNTPRLAEFMIMTESEMRKVSWPSRREVMNSTKIVILLTFLLAGILWAVDVGFWKLFASMGIL